MRQTIGFGGVLALLAHGAVMGFQPADAEQLYVCAGAANADITEVGLTLCNADATPELEERADADNLHVREGVLVVELESAGISSAAGLQAGDMIYRIGGVNVASAESAAKMLATIDTDSDTVVNFLRGGRPYRVKLRQN